MYARSRSADRTRSIILDLVRESDEATRGELAARSGFTEATISTVVRRLIDEGLVFESGLAQSTGGKRRSLLSIKPSARSAVGVSLARDAITVVVADLAMHIIVRVDLPGTGDDEPIAVVDRVAREVLALLEAHDIDAADVVGIGVASPGPLDTVTGTIRGRQPGHLWRGFPLEEELEERTGLRTILDNDATCAALGEFWSSRRRPTPVSATVYVADGIGCGILIGGQVFHGSSSNAGELGHISLDTSGPACHCGARGCVETYASPLAVSARALDNPELSASLDLEADPAAARRNVQRLALAAEGGSLAAREVLSDAAAYLARGIVTLSNLLDLDEVQLAGPGFRGAEHIYAEVISAHLKAGTFMRDVHPVRVTISHLGTETAALGAVALILQHQLTPHSASPGRRATRKTSIAPH